MYAMFYKYWSQGNSKWGTKNRREYQVNNFLVRSIHEVAGYTKMCIWYSPENYDIWQPSGHGCSGYHNFYCIYIQLLLFLISAIILVLLGSLHYVHFSYFDVGTSIIEKSALLSVFFFVIKYIMLNFRHRASCILGQAFRYSPENAFYIFKSTNIFHCLIFAWPCIIDINNIDNQLDATITVY